MKNASSDNNTKRGKGHICLTGGWFSSDNVGDHAILTGIIDSFCKYRNFEFTVLTADPKKVISTYGIPAYSPKKNPIKLVQSVIKSNVLMFTGGTPFYEDKIHMTYFWVLVEIASLFKTPVVIYGVSLRSIKSFYTSLLLRRILNKCSLIGAREEKTKEKFTQITNKIERINYLPDLGLQALPISGENAAELMKAKGIDVKKPTIGICLRDFRSNRGFQLQHYSRGFSDETHNRYYNSISSLISHVMDKYSFQIVFFPMHTNEPDDDRKIALDIVNTNFKGYKKRIYILDEQYNPKEMKAMLGLMKAVVGVRFHSVVLATSMEVPTISICYALKNQAYMEKIKQSKYAIDLFEISAHKITALFDSLIDNYNSIKNNLNYNKKLQHAYFLNFMEKVLLIIDGK